MLVLDSLHSAVALHSFVDAYRDRIVCVVSSESMRGFVGEGLLKETAKYLRNSGVAYLLYLSTMQILFKPFAPLASLIGRITGRRRRAFTLKQVCKKNCLKIVRARNVNEPDFVRQIADMKPDLVVLLYFDQILKAPIIATPKFGVVNTHPGLLPENRGPAPGFWAIRMQHTEIGAAVHMINDTQIDAGPVLGTRMVERKANKSMVAVDCESMRIGTDLAIEAVRDIENGTAVPIRQDPARQRYYPHPSRQELRQFWRQGGRLFRFSEFVEQFLERPPPSN